MDNEPLFWDEPYEQSYQGVWCSVCNEFHPVIACDLDELALLHDDDETREDQP